MVRTKEVNSRTMLDPGKLPKTNLKYNIIVNECSCFGPSLTFCVASRAIYHSDIPSVLSGYVIALLTNPLPSIFIVSASLYASLITFWSLAVEEGRKVETSG